MSNWNAETAEWYAKKYGDYSTNALGVKDLNLAPDSTVVDIGCGTGIALRYASEKVTDGILIGVDPVPRMVGIASEQTEEHIARARIFYYVGFAESLPLKDQSADFVFAFDSFDHWSNHPQGLSEVRRILKSSGQFVVVKDGGLPNRSEAKSHFKNYLIESGFTVADEKDLQDGKVKCTRWICLIES